MPEIFDAALPVRESGFFGEVRVAADENSLARAAAWVFIAELRAALASRPEVQVLLSGGFAASAVLPFLAAAQIDFSRLHLWWVDERLVPPGHADRNDLAALAALGQAAKRMHLHPMPAFEVDPADLVVSGGLTQGVGEPGNLSCTRGALRERLTVLADQYGGELAAAAPVFQVALLGMGPDGHIASLFPGHDSLFSPDPVLVELDSPKMPPLRLTLGPSLLTACPRVLVVAAGGAKAQAVDRVLSGADFAEVPVALVARPGTSWLLDEAAWKKRALNL